MTTSKTGSQNETLSHKSCRPLKEKYSILQLLLLLTWIPAILADNRTTILVDMELMSRTNFAASIDMQSAGFIDLSLLEFASLDYSTTIDIAVFAKPEDDAAYDTIGLGNLDGDVCCTRKQHKARACATVGRLSVDKAAFEGVLISVHVPAMENVTIDRIEFDPVLFFEKEGTYSLLFANCNPNVTTIDINGIVTWDSLITDEDIQDSVPFYVALTLAYLILTIWFRYLMNQNESSRVKLEEYIFGTILLGFLETLFSTIDYAVDSKSMIWLDVVTIFFGTCKNGIARCVLMMVSLGWCVSVPSLSVLSMSIILTLGLSYTVFSFTIDISQTKAAASVEEADTDDNSGTLTGPARTVAVFFPLLSLAIWIFVLVSLNFTIKNLEESRQEQKLRRYKWLLNIMILAVVMNIVAVVFISSEISNGLNVNITVWPATEEAGFFLVVLCVAYLWKPNPNAREFAYVEELNMDSDAYDLELTENPATSVENERIGDRELT
jgi:Lung seven transmembrane receptor